MSETELRAAVVVALDDAAQRIPAGQPAWPDVLDTLRLVRRRRRLRTARRVGGGLLVATCAVALAAVQLGRGPFAAAPPSSVVPSLVGPSPSVAAPRPSSPASGTAPGAIPAVLPSSPPRLPGSTPSALAGKPTKGSLKHDTVWLDAFRSWIGEHPEPGPDGTTSRTSASDVDVIFAGDVGTHRFALVELPTQMNGTTSWQQAWLAGPKGAAASALKPVISGTALDTQVNVVDQFGASASIPAVVVFVTADDQTVDVAGPPVLRADGVLDSGIRRLVPSEPGLSVDILPRLPLGGAYRYRLGAGPWSGAPWGYSGQPDFSGVAHAMPAVHPSTSKPAMDLLRLRALELSSLLGLTTTVHGVPEPLVAPTRVIWVGPMGGWQVMASAITAPSGAHMLFVDVGHDLPTGRSNRSSGEGRPFYALAPAGPLSRLALAFDMVAPGTTRTAAAPTATSVGLIGPSGAVRATVTDTAGAVTPVSLVDGIGTAPVAQAVLAIFFDAGGHQLATSQVAPLDQPLPDPWGGP